MNTILETTANHVHHPRNTVVFHDDLEPTAATHQRYAPPAASHTLALGTTDYGPGYYLDGQAVHDGSRLALETFWGWQDGLFTWTGSPLDKPKLVFFGGQPALCLETDDVLQWMNSCITEPNRNLIGASRHA